MPPRGRPRKNCDWVDGVGWVQRAGTGASLPSVAIARPVIARPVIARPVIARPVIARPVVADEAAVEEARVAKEEAARAEQERVELARKAAIERERLEAPWRYALSLQCNLMRTRAEPPPIYYFDVKGNFCELGKEPKEPSCPRDYIKKKKKTKRTGLYRVVGPRQTKSGWLSAGESEYLSD